MANNNKEEYRKQVARIKRAMKRLEKHGYTFTESPLPDEQPAHPTKKQIEELERMNTERLYYRTVMIDKETGELLAQGRRLTCVERQKQLERKGKLSLAQEYGTMVSTQRGVPVEIEGETTGTDTVAPDSIRSNIIIENFKENCQQNASILNTNFMSIPQILLRRTLNWLSAQINQYGIDAVADMIEEASSSGVVPTPSVFYNEDNNAQFSVDLMKFLRDVDNDLLTHTFLDIKKGVYDFIGESADEFEMVGM